MAKLKTSRTLLQLIWNPRPGDRVLLKRLGRPRFATVRDLNLAGDVLLDWPGEWYKIRKLTFVPRRRDYNKILEQLSLGNIFEWFEKDPEHLYMYKCSVRSVKAMIQISGSSQDVLTKVLDIRAICPEVNDAINELVNKTRGAGAIRFQALS